MKTYWRVALVVLFYPLFGCVPGLFPLPLGGFGYCMRTVQPDGQPIAGASVAVVLLPAGGAAELERRVRAHEPLDGWMATTDKRGKAQLADNLKLQSKRDQRAEPSRYVFSETSRAYERELPAAGEASPDKAVLDLDDTVGLVVLATDYEPYVGTARLDRKGVLPKLTLTTITGREPSRHRESATVTLDPVRRIVAGATTETGSGVGTVPAD